MTIKNIIFDLGGILCGLNPDRCIHSFEQIGAGSVAHFVAEHRVEDLFLDSETGKINAQQFCDEVRRITSKNIPDNKIVWAWNQLLTPIAAWKLAKLKELGQHHRLFLLSNTNDMHWQYCQNNFFKAQGADAYSCFEKVFLSFEMHLIKPSEEIFRAVIEQTGITPADTLFIDDTAANLLTARRMGFQTRQTFNENDIF